MLPEMSIRILDDMFKEAQQLLVDNSNLRAFEKFDAIKHYLKGLQNQGSRIVTGASTVAGTIVGIGLPGIGNILGAILGAAAGNLIGKHMSNRAFKYGGTLEDFVELAGAGKREAENRMLAIKRRLEPSSLTMNYYSEWLVLKKRLL